MTTDRPYRKGMKFGEAIQIFERERESGQSDPKLVVEFVQLVKVGFGG
jgi:HD-GYP domain-containing protein (c-di-GMP phosphodiesterase class II)